MAADDVYPAEMPDHPAPPTLPLDDDTAERLLAARLDPADAPPGYAEVARLLQAAAAPAHPDELAGEPAALAMFRAARSRAVGSFEVPPERGRPAGARARLVALALAGTLVTGGVAVAGGLWTGADVHHPGRLRSPTGGPAAGGSGSGLPGTGGRRQGPVASWGLGAGRGRVDGVGGDGRDRRSDLRRGVGAPAARERVTAHDGGDTSRRGGSAHGIKPDRPGARPEPKPNPNNGKPDKGKPAKAKPAKA